MCAQVDNIERSLVRELLALFTAEAMAGQEQEASSAVKGRAAPADILLGALTVSGDANIRRAALSQVSPELFVALPPDQQDQLMQASGRSHTLPNMCTPQILCSLA